MQVSNWNAINGLLTWMRVMKYLDVVSNKTKLLADTIALAAGDVFVFAIMFFVVYFGFAIAFHVAFGQESFVYHNIALAMSSNFRTILGQFDFDELKRANRILDPLLFFSFNIVVLFLLVNMFLAVIMRVYDAVSENSEEDPDDLSTHMRKLMKKRVSSWLQKLIKKKKKPKAQGGKVVPVEEEDDEEQVSLEEMKRIWEQDSDALKALGLKDPKELCDVADRNQDGKLSMEEVLQFAEQRKQMEAPKDDPSAEITYLVFKVMERFSTIQFEQEEIAKLLQEMKN